MVAVKEYAIYLSYASGELQHDKEVVIVAVRSNGIALKYDSIKHRSGGNYPDSSKHLSMKSV